MSGFIPKEKMSKKARKALDNRQRLTWPKSPAMRTIESKKTYNRKRESHDYRNEKSWDFICL